MDKFNKVHLVVLREDVVVFRGMKVHHRETDAECFSRLMELVKDKSLGDNCG